MKEIQEIKNDIMLLKNLGNIPKEVELVLLRKLTSLEKLLVSFNVVGQSEQLCDKCNKEKQLQKLTGQAQELNLGYDD